MARYYRPADITDAIAALTDGGADTRILVGGTDLLVGYRHGRVDPLVFVDLKAAADIPPPIVIDDHMVRIGPTATMTDVAAHPAVRSWFPALVEAAEVVGSVAIRNRASLIGNVCNASPAADSAPALLVHDAHVTIRSRHDERTIPLHKFFLGPRLTACQADEVVTQILIPRPTGEAGSAFQRLTRRRGVDLASVSVAASVSGDGEVMMGMGAVAPRPLLSTHPGRLDGTDEAAVDDAVDGLVAAAVPISDIRASEDYRRAMVRVLAHRALQSAFARRYAQEVFS